MKKIIRRLLLLTIIFIVIFIIKTKHIRLLLVQCSTIKDETKQAETGEAAMN